MTKITSAGIIRNSEKPRVGVISSNSDLLNSDYINDLLDPNNCIDLTYELCLQGLEEKELTEEEIEAELDCYERGDLDTEGDSVIAYDLPKEFYKKEGK